MINYEQKADLLRVSFFNQEGEISFKDINIEKQLFEWHESEKGTKYSWDNRKVIKKNKVNLSKHRINEILNSLDITIVDEIFANNKPKKFIVNIQTTLDESSIEYKNASEPILTISALSCKTNTIFVLSTRNADKESTSKIENSINEYFKEFDIKFNLKFLYFKTEYDMLYSFFGSLCIKMPLITGWDFISKDWNYLNQRAKKLLINTSICSPSKNLLKYNIPQHRLVIDYFKIFDYLDNSIKIKESSELDWIAKNTIGIGKLKTKYSLKNLYNNDFINFVLSGAVNCILIKLIENKFNLIDLALTLSNVCKVSCYEYNSMIAMIENLCLKQAHKENIIILPNSKNEKLPYKGGYVMEPKKDLYENIALIDFRSLYASIIMQWNVSPDSVYEGEDEDRIIKTKNGINFDKNKKGIITSFLEEIMENRNKASRLALEYKSDIENLLKKI